MQLEEGKRFFARKYPQMKYLAYFQAYTNTYGELELLKRMYEEALAVEGVVGLVIGTRPDCMPDSLLDYLEEVNRRTFLLVEYGIECGRPDSGADQPRAFLCMYGGCGAQNGCKGHPYGRTRDPGITGREPGRSHKAGGTSVGTAAHNAEDAPASAHSRNAHGA